VGRKGIAAVVAMAAALAAAPSAHAYAHATFTASPNPGGIGTTIIFDATGSTGSGELRYHWDLDGDGTYETDTGPSPSATKTYSGAGTIVVGLEVYDTGDGSTDTTNVPVTVLAPTEPDPEQDDVTPPVISNAFISPKAFRLGRKATPLNGHISAIKRGAKLTWTLSEGANLAIRIQRCSTKKKCTPHVTVKMHRTVAAGTRSLAFSGRVELRKLKPGGYRFVLDATDLAGNFSDTVYVPFVILRG
jgi:hypothetical protein